LNGQRSGSTLYRVPRDSRPSKRQEVRRD